MCSLCLNLSDAMTLLQAYTMAVVLAMPRSATHSVGRLLSGWAVWRRGCDNMARDTRDQRTHTRRDTIGSLSDTITPHPV
mmetsp:Transcript_10239/g.20892  ORF Transcript_10239/g.20892 Transcript_10239/m.20892 type:complete len:80 (+) Transcript_10239:505-744(+)